MAFNLLQTMLIISATPAIQAIEQHFRRLLQNIGQWTSVLKLAELDVRADTFAASINAEWLSKAMRAITYLGSSWAAVPLAAGIAWILYRRKEWRASATVLVTLSSGEVFIQILKWAFNRARPADITVHVYGASFPSGHAFTSIVVYGFVIYLIWRWRIRHVRFWSAALAAVIAIVGFSRVYLHAHYLTDVLGGYVLGLAWLAAGISFARFISKNHAGE
jgi:membrane-associated phospholipid phosphatase